MIESVRIPEAPSCEAACACAKRLELLGRLANGSRKESSVGGWCRKKEYTHRRELIEFW